VSIIATGDDTTGADGTHGRPANRRLCYLLIMKVLFIYANRFGTYMLPPAIGILSSVLKRGGHETRLFDTTDYAHIEGFSEGADDTKVDRLMVRPSTRPDELTLKTSDCFDDLELVAEDYRPDLIAVSTTEDMFRLSLALLRRIRRFNIPTIAGGVFPTFAPTLALAQPEIDIVCVGEGEDALLELCNRLSAGKRYHDIPNLWARDENGKVCSNPTRMVDLSRNPLIDISIFDESRYYRPMMGKYYRMFPVETHRGCPYTCAFCNSPSQMRLYKESEGQNFLRRKTFKQLEQELLFYRDSMKAEFLYFWADTFFSWSATDFDEFCEMYRGVGLPFWCQTRPETITEHRLEKLQEIGCARMSLGIEHGNEDFRAKWLSRRVNNKVLIEKFRIMRDSGLSYSVNNIVGFPHETLELAMDTVELNRAISADDAMVYHFTPFAGTPLRSECEKLGYITKADVVESNIVGNSMLDMPQFPKHEISGFIKTFNMLVRFRKNRWPEIRRAAYEDEPSREQYAQLRSEYQSTFFA